MCFKARTRPHVSSQMIPMLTNDEYADGRSVREDAMGTSATIAVKNATTLRRNRYPASRWS